MPDKDTDTAQRRHWWHESRRARPTQLRHVISIDTSIDGVGEDSHEEGTLSGCLPFKASSRGFFADSVIIIYRYSRTSFLHTPASTVFYRCAICNPPWECQCVLTIFGASHYDEPMANAESCCYLARVCFMVRSLPVLWLPTAHQDPLSKNRQYKGYLRSEDFLCSRCISLHCDFSFSSTFYTIHHHLQH